MNQPTINSTGGTFRILRQVSQALTSKLDLQEVLQTIMVLVTDMFQPQDWSLLLIDEQRQELEFTIAIGEASQQLKGLRLKMGEGIAGWVAQNGKPLMSEDVKTDTRFADWIDQQSGFDTQSAICWPLQSKGVTLGVIEMLNVGAASWEDDRFELLQALSDFAAVAIETARYISRVQGLTVIDECTGLYNSRFMYQRLSEEICRSERYHQPLSVVFLDLDHFKRVNDSFDHLVGSRLLKEVGQVFVHGLRNVDSVIRYGGDEFVLILPSTSKEGAALVTRRLRTSLKENSFSHDIKVNASFGVATFPDDALNKEDLVRAADQAMYRIKNSTRDGLWLAGCPEADKG